MARLSGFGDEVTDDFLGQVRFLASEKVPCIEPRFINGKNMMDLSKGELAEARKMISDFGLSVSAIGSPIGKVRLDESFGKHLDKFKHAVDLAHYFETRFIRIFSYYAPEGEAIDDYRDKVLGRLERQIQVIKDVDVVMVHENEARIYGHSAANCADLAKALDSEKFKLAYDPANFVWGEKIKGPIESCWPMMKPYVVHIHIKDWKLGADTGSIPGEGDGQIEELVGELAAMDYKGCLTLEPHLQAGGQFGGKTGPELFSKAIKAVREIAEEVGLELES
jgi:sugar phosphate isomerase/epimerase